MSILINMLNEAYLHATKRLPEMMEAIQNASVPKRFTIEFLKTLGFKSTNDRAFVSVLKGIGFLDDSGVPNEKYKSYKNKSNAKEVLAEALRVSYEDLFLAHENAESLPTDKLQGIFATKTGKGNASTKKMASTFKVLCSVANFESQVSQTDESYINTDESDQKDTSSNSPGLKGADFHYNIQVHLPATKDISVYNAIFKSIKEHLL